MMRNRIMMVALGGFLAIVLLGVYFYLTRPVLSDTEILLYTGYTKTVTLKGRVKEAVWQSMDEGTAIVEDGAVTGITQGKTEISARVGKQIYTCQVTVRKAMSNEYAEIVKKEKKWIFSQQLTNGAFANRYKADGEVVINPYFAAETVCALLECELTEEEYECIRSYFDWHFSHLNTADINGLGGTIYDYRAQIDSGVVKREWTEAEYDSVDSYAALFLKALWRYYECTGDLEYLHSYKEQIWMVKEALCSTIGKNGYSIAKPDYPMVYLMDNAEVYAGLKSAMQLFDEILEDKSEAGRLSEMVENYEKNFEGNWWKDEHYAFVFGEEKFDWKQFYPDAASQVFPIVYGLAGSRNRDFLYQSLCSHWNWQELDYYNNGDADFYWGILFYCGAVLQDEERTEQYAQEYQRLTAERKYPLYVADAAWVMAGCQKMYEYFYEQEWAHSDKF